MKKDHKIRTIGSFATGISHIEKQLPCQDKILSKSYNSTTVIALADGASKYKNSGIGAETVTSYICEYLVENFDVLYKKKNEEIAKTVLVGMREKLIKKAKSLDLNVEELSSTILFVGVNNNRYLAGHIGDGMIGCFVENKALPLSNPDNDDEYTVFPMNKGALKRFRIYRNDLKTINGFILMSDGTYDSLFHPATKKLVNANNIMFEWVQNLGLSEKKVESELKNTIKEQFLKNSVNRDDCSVNILAITDEKVRPTEIRKIDMKQVNDNTQKIKILSTSMDSLKTKIENIEDKISQKINKNELSEKVDKNDLKKYDSELGKLKSNQSEDTKIIKQLKEEIASVKKELKNINNKSVAEISNDEITSLIEWKNTIQPILYILIAGLIGFGGVIIKLLFF